MDETPFYCNWCRTELGRIAPASGLMLRPDVGMAMEEIKQAIGNAEGGSTTPIVRLTCPECDKMNLFLLSKQAS